MYLNQLFKGKDKTAQPDIRTAKGFEMIYTRFFRKMYLACFSKTADEHISKDIVQDIFRSLWDRRAQLSIEVEIESYLMRCLKFKIIDHFRAANRQQQMQQVRFYQHTHYANNTEDHISYIDLKSRLDKHTGNLPQQCRKIFSMSRDQGLSNKKIAESLCISERAVAYHIASALHFFRKKGLNETVDL